MSSASICQQRSVVLHSWKGCLGRRWKSTGDSGHLLPCWCPLACKGSSWASRRGLFALEGDLRFSDAHWAVPSPEEQAVHAHVEGDTKKNPTPHRGRLRSFPRALKMPSISKSGHAVSWGQGITCLLGASRQLELPVLCLEEEGA